MNNYEFLMSKAGMCNFMASLYEGSMQKFYLNASKGYQIKARKLTIEEASRYGSK